MSETINFYHLDKPYGYFSNFARYSIDINGKTWATSEHYFQAQKFPGTSHEEEIRQAKSPREAADMGRDRSRPLRPDWEAVKDDVMREALYAKFTQHPDLKEKLLATGNTVLVEHTRNDSYWGDGGDGSGRNMLGKLLMELRDRLQNEIAESK
ncbi:NADAR family protein [Leptolyngbya sp. AN03gr2]|uniref:NADAR family protein n=1 Tax=unclassified Leptolyngbya TaxID=2650499 RepID=UPI003D32364B